MKTVPAAELSARSRFSQRTFAGAHRNGRDAPKAVLRAIEIGPPGVTDPYPSFLARETWTYEGPMAHTPRLRALLGADLLSQASSAAPEVPTNPTGTRWICGCTKPRRFSLTLKCPSASSQDPECRCTRLTRFRSPARFGAATRRSCRRTARGSENRKDEVSAVFGSEQPLPFVARGRTPCTRLPGAFLSRVGKKERALSIGRADRPG
jgi:hypothetical protein